MASHMCMVCLVLMGCHGAVCQFSESCAHNATTSKTCCGNAKGLLMERTGKSFVNVANACPAFFTWNRCYLLQIEKTYNQLTNDSDFALPYWNWTETVTFPSNCDICDGDYLNLNIKCEGCNQSSKFSDILLPSYSEVSRCFKIPNFSPKIGQFYDGNSEDSFCSCVENLDAQVLKFMNLSKSKAMYNPSYLLHLVFIDKILSEWYDINNPAQTEFMEELTPPGSSLYSFVIPFFPPVTHSSLFVSTSALGYTYHIVASQPAFDDEQNNWIVATVLFGIALILTMVLSIFVKCKLLSNHEVAFEEIDQFSTKTSTANTPTSTSDAPGTIEDSKV